MSQVNWHRYAGAYDHMCANNPAYNELVALFRQETEAWPLDAGSIVADLGAGTGNFSLACAERHPATKIVHVDANAEMNALAASKAARLGLATLDFRTQDLTETEFPADSLDAAISVHALYPLKDPCAVIQKVFVWLRPGGVFFCCDLGRVLSVPDWARYLWGEAVRTHGFLRACGIFWSGREVARQNRQISKLQQTGTFWTHTHGEFQAAFMERGFEIIRATEAYRKCSDLVIARKPGNGAANQPLLGTPLRAAPER